MSRFMASALEITTVTPEDVSMAASASMAEMKRAINPALVDLRPSMVPGQEGAKHSASVGSKVLSQALQGQATGVSSA